MSRNKLLLVAALHASACAWTGLAAVNLAAGLSAYRSGDYATALKWLMSLFGLGDIGATHGRGVPKDPTKAVSPSRIAAECQRRCWTRWPAERHVWR